MKSGVFQQDGAHVETRRLLLSCCMKLKCKKKTKRTKQSLILYGNFAELQLCMS